MLTLRRRVARPMTRVLQRDGTSVCGLHAPMVVTPKNIFMPIYGDDEKVRAHMKRDARLDHNK